jgi:hypothetical protein
MSLGWGLRGSIGGGPLGAMIPGAMVGLALCLLLGRCRDAGRIAAFAAIGVGFGGQETYGQTVGLSLHPETFWWAILGFAIKGAAWGLLGGAFLGIALRPDRFTARRLAIAFALMCAGTWLGWSLINDPKLIYFSNRLDRPRVELWAGLWLGGLLLLAWLRERVPARFALYGTIGGGIGFAVGASLQPWGKGVWATMPLGWWKGMELTFGGLLGLAFGLCAWHLRDQLAREADEMDAPAPVASSLALAVLAVAAIAAGEAMPGRFGYTLAGAVLAWFAWRSPALAWQSAITATFAAFSYDAVKHVKLLESVPAWGAMVVATVLVGIAVARCPLPRPMFLLLTWTGVANAFRYLAGPLRVEPVTMLAVFVLLAVVITIAAPKCKILSTAL